MAYKITGTTKVFNFRKCDYFFKAWGLQAVGAGYDKVTGEKYNLFLIDDEFNAALADWNDKKTQDEYSHKEYIGEYGQEESLREY